jgi:hypothetical protein
VGVGEFQELNGSSRVMNIRALHGSHVVMHDVVMHDVAMHGVAP